MMLIVLTVATVFLVALAYLMALAIVAIDDWLHPW